MVKQRLRRHSLPLLIVFFVLVMTASVSVITAGATADYFIHETFEDADALSAFTTNLPAPMNAMIMESQLEIYTTGSSSGTTGSVTRTLYRPLTFQAGKKYVFAFDFSTDRAGEMRNVFTVNGGDFNSNLYFARLNAIKVGGVDTLAVLYPGGNTVVNSDTSSSAYLEKNRVYSFAYVVDGTTRRVEKLYIDGETVGIDDVTKFPTLPEEITNISIFQKNWSKTSTKYDNLKIYEVAEGENIFLNGIVFKQGNNVLSALAQGAVDVIYDITNLSNSEQPVVVIIAMYEDDALEEIICKKLMASPGIKPYTETINIGESITKVKAMLWNSNITPLGNYELLDDNGYGNRMQDMLTFKSEYLKGLRSTSDVNELLSGIRVDGSWADISYNGYSGSTADVHCERIEKIARCISTPQSVLYNDAQALQKINLAINYWINKDIKFNNWYQNEVRIPLYLGNTLLVVGGMLEEEVENQARNYLYDKIVNEVEPHINVVGQNAVEMQINRILYAMHTVELERFESAFYRIQEEIVGVDKLSSENAWRDRLWENYVNVFGLPDTKEGIQVDNSYLFHGPLPYAGGYGLTFINKVTDLMAKAVGTNLFTEIDTSDLVNYVLEHYAYIMRGTTLDYNTIGRHVANTNGLALANNGTGIRTTVKKLSELEHISRRDELISLYNALNEDVPTPAVTGHKYYWKAHYTAHPKQGYLLGLRTSSNRILSTEIVSTVNLKGDFLGDGCTYIYRNGDEYDDIFAAWDWRKIPGTTSQLREFTPLMIQHNVIAGSHSDYAGGVSDGVNGATAMQLVRDGVSAKKAWFMFDDEFVALGSDLNSTSENEMVTTVNQCLLKGAVTVGKTDNTEKVLELGSHTNQEINWAHHDNIGYVFNEGANVAIDNKAFQGDRVDINYGGFMYRPDRTDLVTKNIFSLWFNHTVDNTDAYAYTVLPGVSVEHLKNYAKNNPLDIISNSSTLQAVAHKGLNTIQAVFWTPGSVATPDGTTITVDDQVLLQVVKKDNKAVVSVSSINASSGTVNIQMSGNLNGNGAYQLTEGNSAFSVTLPAGDYAGQSVVLEFDIME